MKKVLVVEDQAQYRENWKSFFTKFSTLLDVEVEVIETVTSSEELMNTVLKKVADSYYLIIDNDLRGYCNDESLKIRGEMVCVGLEGMGFHGKVAMISAHQLDGRINLGKGTFNYACVLDMGAFLLGYDKRIDYENIPEENILAYRNFAGKARELFEKCN